MDKRTKKEIQSKHGAKKTPKPKYNLWQNTGFMLRTSRKYAKSVFPLCIVLALLSAGKSVAELLIAPAILNKIELSASLGSVVFTIAAFALVLMLLSGLRSYVDTNALFGRIAVRSQGIYLSISRKYAKTSYPNLLNTDFLALGEKASAACAGNSESSEAIWTTLTDLMTSCIGFIVYLALLTNLNLWLAALVAATTAVSYFASKRINEWGYLHRSEELELTKRIEYANKTATSREFAKDIRMFGLRGWLEDLWGSTMRLYSAFCAKRERKYIWANIIDIVLTFLRNGIAYAFLIGITVKNGLPASQFLLYFAALSGFAQWVVEILDKLSVMHKQSLDISTIREFLDWDEPFDLNGGERIAFEPNKQYEIRLDNVSFRYPKADKDTLSHINLTVHPAFRVVGEAFKTYILVEIENNLYYIDKHAAHERMNFEALRRSAEIHSQLLLAPVSVRLNKAELSAVEEHLDLLQKGGFEVEIFGTDTVLVRSVPAMLDGANIADLICEIAEKLLEHKTDIEPEKLDWIFHSTACRAAVKAGDVTSPAEQRLFVEKLLSMPDIRYCPHGRPVMIKVSRYEIEKQFGRA